MAMKIQRFSMQWKKYKNKAEARAIIQKTVSAFLNKNLCQNAINTRYFFVDSMQAQNAYLYHATTDDTGDLVGFAIVKKEFGCKNTTKKCERKPLTWFVEVLCGKQGSGLKLMKRVETDARKAKQRYVQLKALLPVIAYYRQKLGYTLSYNCNKEPALEKSLEKILKLKRIDTDFKKSIRRKATREFIKTMINYDLHANAEGCRIPKKYTGYTSDQSLYDCSIDGFTMTLCLKRKKVNLST